MSEPGFVAGDWGTTHLRLFLCEGNGRVLDSVSGPGAADVHGDFPHVFDSLLASWRQRHGPLPAVLCGMVGSSIGWTQVPYVPCPVRPAQIAGACLALRDGDVQIVPGLSCKNRLGSPDFMRGEETQLLGALAQEPSLRSSRHLLCLPGTHTKWVALEDGEVRDFLTAPTGELFAVLRDHSVLVHQRDSNESGPGAAAFASGLAEFNRLPDAQVLHRLFECRARRLAGDLSEADAAPYLSGLLIASDVAGALRLFADYLVGRSVGLIGTPRLTALYASALRAHGLAGQLIDGSAAALAGLTHVHKHLVSPVGANDT